MNKKPPKETLVLGIDTGGTYTDGVLLEYNTSQIIAAHKSLTTKRDFSIGIENVIKEIELEDPSAILRGKFSRVRKCMFDIGEFLCMMEDLKRKTSGQRPPLPKRL